MFMYCAAGTDDLAKTEQWIWTANRDVTLHYGFADARQFQGRQGLIGTPEEVFSRLNAAQQACSFSEVTIVAQFGTMPYDEAMESIRLFAREVLPEVHKMDAPLHPAALPENALA